MSENIFSAQSDAERSALRRPAEGLFWLAAAVLLGTALYAFPGHFTTTLALVTRVLAALHDFHLGWAGVALTLLFVGEYARRRSIAGERMRQALATPDDPDAVERACLTTRALAEWLMQHHLRVLRLLAVVFSLALLSAFAGLFEQLYAESSSPAPSDALFTIVKTMGAVLLPLVLTIFLRSGLMLQSILGLATADEDAGFKHPQPRLPWESDSDGYGLRVNAARLAGDLVTLKCERDAYQCIALLANAPRTLRAFESGARGARELKKDEVYVEWAKGLGGALGEPMSREQFIRHLRETVPGMTPSLAERIVANPLRK